MALDSQCWKKRRKPWRNIPLGKPDIVLAVPDIVNYPSLKGGAWKKRCSPHLTNQDAKRLTSRSLTN